MNRYTCTLRAGSLAVEYPAPCLIVLRLTLLGGGHALLLGLRRLMRPLCIFGAIRRELEAQHCKYVGVPGAAALRFRIPFGATLFGFFGLRKITKWVCTMSGAMRT